MFDARIITPIPSGLLAAVDEYRFTNRIPSRAEAIRRLLEAGMGQERPKVPLEEPQE